ncbi:MAG: aldo/keto reductase [Acidobacteriota bacterium]|nr:aldo/keto reductase [Acidobacteriota bacterium]MDE3106992.1 aldo/keto reductase [Acidobacteriota bacterium]MDE3221829.1 aldo/keto reductase [Acidobacteriota bacterium]
MTNQATFTYADQTVRRLGYGAMRITGPGVWGWPEDVDQARAVLRRAVELGVDFIDTADSYGPEVSETLIREALHPYGDVRVATKAGLLRTGPNVWVPCGRPDYLRQQCELSLRRLGVERLDLFQLHRVDPTVAADEQFALLRALLDEGKVAAVGLSEVTVAQIVAARSIVPIATVQNHYNLSNRQSEDVLDYCEANNIGFIPWYPVAAGVLARPGGPLDALASEQGLSVAQLSLAWLLARSPVMMPIPGTSSVAHLEENCAAANVELDESTLARLAELSL